MVDVSACIRPIVALCLLHVPFEQERNQVMAGQVDERFDRLPKWVQQRIAKLEGDVAYYKAELAAGPEDSNTFAEPHRDKPRPLGSDVQIRFQFGPHWAEYIDACIVRGALEIRGAGEICVSPRASNLISVSITGRSS